MNQAIHYTKDAEGIGTLLFDKQGSSANIFDRVTLEELTAHLDTIEQDTALKGLVLLSAKPSIFIAGADISEFQGVEDEEQIRGFVKQGQDLFTRIENLSIPTVAGIHGACLGGGCEITLACDYRIASPYRATRIGLPEVTLGILPAWGGCYRLSRRIGLPGALNLILTGKHLAPKPAKSRGLVDELVPKEHFPRIAAGLIAKGKAKPRRLWKTNNPLVAWIALHKSRQTIQSKTRGLYPAPPRALDTVIQAMSATREAAMRLEQDAVVDLLKTPACQNLVNIFFLQERSKKLKVEVPEADQDKVRKKAEAVAVVGAGVMGAGIAQWASSRGQRVMLRDINTEQLGKGMATIGKLYAEAVKRYIFTRTEAARGMDRIQPVCGAEPMQHLDVVIEAATENMELKKKIFAGLDAGTREDTLLATNTSALSVSELAAATRHPQRVVGVHFFNPVNRMQLVEVIRGKETSPLMLARAVKYVQGLGKMPVVVNDSPGFLVNRVLIPYLVEAGMLFEQGVDQKVIDGAMLDFGMPMGPLRLIDEVGVDVAHHVASFFQETFGERMPMPAVLSGMKENGDLGRKAGKGFYVYRQGKETGEPNPRTQTMIKGQTLAGLNKMQLQNRMVMLMINEAAMCMAEGVVEDPRDADFGMIMGTGFAPFRGGPLRFADTLGLKAVVDAMNNIAEVSGDTRFKPCDLLVSMAGENKKFYEEQ